jgi:hypothetical protein
MLCNAFVGLLDSSSRFGSSVLLLNQRAWFFCPRCFGAVFGALGCLVSVKWNTSGVQNYP